MRAFAILIALGLGVSAYAGNDLFRPGDDIHQLLEQAEQAYSTVPQENPQQLKPLTDLEELALLNSNVKLIKESEFKAVTALLAKKLRVLTQEAVDASNNREQPFRNWQASEGLPQPPQRRGLTEIHKDARNILRYVFFQSMRTKTAKTEKSDQIVLRNALVSVATATTLVAYLALTGHLNPAYPMSVTMLTGIVFGVPAVIVGNSQKARMQFNEGMRVFRAFANEIRESNIAWAAVGIDLEVELRALALLLNETDQYSDEYRKLCNNLLGDPTFFAPLEKKRVAKSEPQIRVGQQAEPEIEAAVESAPELLKAKRNP